jgi:prefoldin subunit 2
MAEKAKTVAKPAAPSKKTAEDIINGFNALRNDQRRLTQKISELESDRSEHKLVINTLKETDASRRCYRLIGGILVERTVGEVLPALQNNVEQIDKVIETLNGQAVAKGKELNEYREKHNIRLAGVPPKGEEEGDGDKEPKSASESTGVLVDATAHK